MSFILGFDPLQIVTEIAVLGAAGAALVVAVHHRHRVLQALTGDDRIHGTSLDLLWFICCNWCGLCTGEWTRCFTLMPCCPKRMRGQNLLRRCGQCFGLVNYTVELKNIVVGDLPYDRRGDFYLEVECAANPPMMSSLAEEKHPKVVHFPEILTLRLRWSPLEQPVRITVKELNILGSVPLCECHIGAMSILAWSSEPNERMKRFVMESMRPGLERETQAWILLEMDQPTEVRDLDNFHGNVNTIRTSTREGHYKDTSLARFKRDYTLVDGSGEVMDEPLEEDVSYIQNLKDWTYTAHWCCNCSVVFLIVLYLMYRTYAWSCFRQYRQLTIAYMHHADFPISHARLINLVTDCHVELKGTGTATGHPCRPNRTNILSFCKDIRSTKQPVPTAFSGIMVKRFGMDRGIPCVEGVCKHNQFLATWTLCIVGLCIALLLAGCLFRTCTDNLIRKKKDRRHRERVEQKTQMYERMNTERGMFSMY